MILLYLYTKTDIKTSAHYFIPLITNSKGKKSIFDMNNCFHSKRLKGCLSIVS